MNTIHELLRCDGRTSRSHFLRNVLLLAAGRTTIDLQVMYLRTDLTHAWSWAWSWLNPFSLIGPFLQGQVALLICLTTFLFFAGLIRNAAHRARDAGWPHWFGALVGLPFVNVLIVFALAIPASKRRSVWDII